MKTITVSMSLEEYQKEQAVLKEKSAYSANRELLDLLHEILAGRDLIGLRSNFDSEETKQKFWDVVNALAMSEFLTQKHSQKAEKEVGQKHPPE